LPGFFLSPLPAAFWQRHPDDSCQRPGLRLRAHYLRKLACRCALHSRRAALFTDLPAHRIASVYVRGPRHLRQFHLYDWSRPLLLSWLTRLSWVSATIILLPKTLPAR